MSRRLAVWAGLGLVLAADALGAAHHVRVVLDTSISMRQNDPQQLALLATVLLHDLADLERNLGDSFEVLPFDAQQVWRDPADPPPRAVGPRIRFVAGQRDDFVRRVTALSWDAGMTYFFPGLAAALEDLETIARGRDDVGVIVLVTDGVPEPRTREAELALIHRQLAERLEKQNVRVQVLAFGPQAAAERSFFTQLLAAPDGRSLGELFVDPDGSALLETMAQVFADSFGYTRSAPQPLPVAQGLDLEGGTAADRVAIVAWTPRPAPAPHLDLAPMAGEPLSIPGGPRSAAVSAGSYTLQWVLAPAAGRYRLDSDGARAVVLRPSRLVIEVLPTPPLTQARQVMARSPAPVRVRVTAEGGGDPGDFTLAYQAHGPRVGSGYAWSESQSSPKSPWRRVAGGREVDLDLRFPRDPAVGEESYRGFLELEVRRGRAVVGHRVGPAAYPIEVFPYLALTPTPLAGDARRSGGGVHALGRRERACAEFRLVLTDGRLPHAGRPRYSLRAVLDASALTHSAELTGASFTLDGDVLAVDQDPAAPDNRWQKGKELGADELLGRHEICLQTGRPRAGNPERTLELPLRMALVETPYDGAPAIEPFLLRVRFDRPAPLDRWGGLVPLGLIALAALGGLVAHLRPRLPGDLGWAVRREDAGGEFQRGDLAGSSGPAGFLSARRSLVVPGEEKLLGWVRPGRADLFVVGVEPGVTLESLDGTRPTPDPRGLFALEVHRPYRLRHGRDRYLFRLEYR